MPAAIIKNLINPKTAAIINEYQEKADITIRKMISVLMRVYKKVDEHACQAWIEELKKQKARNCI